MMQLVDLISVLVFAYWTKTTTFVLYCEQDFCGPENNCVLVCVVYFYGAASGNQANIGYIYFCFTQMCAFLSRCQTLSGTAGNAGHKVWQ